MEPDEQKPAEGTCAEAVPRPDSERVASPDFACGADEDPRARAEVLLRAYGRAGELGATAPQPANVATADFHQPGPTSGQASAPETSGSRVGRYKLRQLIGEGGFGSV